MGKQYAERDIMALDKHGGHYTRHLSAMTGESLHDKSDIAAELAWRDAEIARLERERDAYRTAEEHQIALRQKIEQEREAMAAHVARIKAEESRAYKGGLSMPGLLHDIIYESPAISLDRRDALKQVEALERLRLLLQETKFDKAPSVARVVMQVNDAINRVKQEVGPLRLVASDHSDPHPNCELECGAYGTYCKCNAEAHQ